MSATNITTNYGLPVFVGTDKPSWLTDWNGAMSNIDTSIKEAKTAGDNAQTTANTNTSSINALDSSLNTLNTSVTTLTSSVSGNTGSINTINSLIGNGEPTTQDKTIIGAINEIAAEIGSGTGIESRVSALETSVSNIDYQIGSTSLPTTAQTLTGAIAEIASGSSSGIDLDFVNAETLTFTPASGYTVDSTVSSSVHWLSNNDNSIGKIYGAVHLTVNSSSAGWNKVGTLSGTHIPTIEEAYNIIVGSGWLRGNLMYSMNERLVFNTNGTIDIEIEADAVTSTSYFTISLPPCLYLLKNLGD